MPFFSADSQQQLQGASRNFGFDNFIVTAIGALSKLGMAQN